MVAWHTATTARARWAGAPKDDDILTELLAVARYQIEQYAEPIPETSPGTPGPIPVTWPMAQVAQARALYESARVAGDADDMGLDGYAQRASADFSARIKRLIGPARVRVG